jgi:single-stranded DNA-binding protein
MTAFALVSGALFRAPEQKTAKTGKPYVAATIKVVTAGDNSADFWSVLAFSDGARAELLRLGEGDKLAMQGAFKVEQYTAPRDGQTRISRTLFAEHVLALRQPPRARKAKGAAPGAPDAPAARGEPSYDEGGHDFDDEIPF